MIFWCGSGSGSCYFRHWPSRRQQKTKLIFKSPFSHKTVRIKGFLLFCLMIEGSGFTALNNGSGSGRLKNKWIWWIRNTGYRTGGNKVGNLGSRSEASAGTAARTCCCPPLLLLLLGHSELHPAADGTGHSELLSARRLGNHPHILPEIFSFSYIHTVHSFLSIRRGLGLKLGPAIQQASALPDEPRCTLDAQMINKWWNMHKIHKNFLANWFKVSKNLVQVLLTPGMPTFIWNYYGKYNNNVLIRDVWNGSGSAD